MNGDNPTAGSIDQEDVKTEINKLLASLQDLKEVFGRYNKDVDTEWQQISTILDSVIKENFKPAIVEEKVGEPLFYPKPAGLHKGFSLGRGRPLQSMLEQRERIHVRERDSNREVIVNLIKGNIALAENFKTVVSAICSERDHRVAELEAKYQKLWDEYEGLACGSSKQPARRQVMMAGFEDRKWSGTFEGASIWEALDMAKARGRAMYWDERPYAISDDDYTSDDEELSGDFEELTVDRQPASVDRQDTEKWGDGLDEKFKGLWAWKPRPQPPAPVAAQAKRAPQVEDGRPRYGKFLEKDNGEEQIYLGCIVVNCSEGESVKPLMCQIDTGASTNITSWKEVMRLGLKYDIKDVGQIRLAEGGTVSINAVARNVRLRIGGATVEVDLNIMPMIEDRERLGETILGTGFLRSTGAVIDFNDGKISFNKIDPTEFYYWRH